LEFKRFNDQSIKPNAQRKTELNSTELFGSVQFSAVHWALVVDNLATIKKKNELQADSCWIHQNIDAKCSDPSTCNIVYNLISTCVNLKQVSHALAQILSPQ